MLRFLAYEQLCYESARLLKFILNLRELTPDLICKLWEHARSSPPDAPALDGLSWADVAIAIMRYQHSVSYEEVASAHHEVVQSWGYSHEQILAMLKTMQTDIILSMSKVPR